MLKTRNYDADGFILRAACVCVDPEERQVLLVSSRRDSRLWIVPGGGVEEGEGTQDAALREVREEAGVNGYITRTLGVFENPERRHRTSVYQLVVKDLLQDWDEARDFGRRRQCESSGTQFGGLESDRGVKQRRGKNLAMGDS
ncbi:hypothetical protein O3P69_013509 [Scylla paramamosain]|uniref:Nudix hydrolase domain-containing protein n=1 Tax=Scylla paramamosain TaxID=85552 RepID=A0AAW0SAM5_SCYPA